MTEESPAPVLCLAGPTACGKTALALAIASQLPCEIINADSRQIYADFPLICAQPSSSEQALVPHHLYGILPTSAAISAGEWCRMAQTTIAAVLARGHVPLLVGGTGMYFQSLLHGIVPIPPIEPALRKKLESEIDAKGPTALYAEVQRIDPLYAAKIHPHDRQRIIRVLEVYAQTGQNFTWWHSQENLQKPRVTGPLYVLKAPLSWLEPRIAFRIDEMLANGAIEEAKAAYARTPDEQAPAWSGIGCTELLAYLLGRLALDDAKALWRANTRAYAKRQNTWFRGRPEAIFFAPTDCEELCARAVRDWASLTDVSRSEYAREANERSG